MKPQLIQESAEELYENAPCGYLSTRPDGTIIRVNQTFLNLTGYTRAALIDTRRIQELMTRPGQVFYETHFAPQLRMQGFVREIACDLARPDRSPLPVLLNAVQVLDEAGQPALLRFTIFDATERRRYERDLVLARQRAEQYEDMVQASADAIFSWDAQGIVQTWNTSAERLIGYTAREAIGQPVNTLLVPEMGADQISEIGAATRMGRTIQREMVCIGRDGRRLDVSVSLTPHIEPPDELTRISAILRDISERKQVQETLRLERERLIRAQQAAHVGIWDWDIQTGKTTCTDETWTVLGRAPGEFELTVENWLSCMHPDDRTQAASILKAAYQTGQIRAEFRVIGADQAVRWVELRGELIFDAAGQVIRVLGTAQGITDRKSIEERMRVSEVRYRRLFEAAHDGIILIDPATRRITDANPFMTELLGYPPDQLIGRELYEIGLQKDPAACRAMVETLQQHGQLRYEIKPTASHEGHAQEVEVVANLYDEDGRAVIQCNIRDITERKRVEEQLRKVNERFLIAEEASNGFVYEWNIASGTEVRSDGFTKVLGYTHADVPNGGSEWDRLIHPDDVMMVRSTIEDLIASGATSAQNEYRLRHKDGHWVWVTDKYTQVWDEHGVLRSVIGSIADITHRKRAEQALQEREHFLQRITEVMPGVLHVFDLQERRSIFINQSITTVLDYSPEEVQALGSEVLPTLMHPEDLLRFEAHVQRVRTLDDHQFADFEHRMRDRAGQWHWFQNRDAVFARDAQGQVTQTIGTAIEITERKQAELDTQFLSDFTALLNYSTDPEAMAWIAASETARHLHAARAGYVSVDVDRDRAAFQRDFFTEGDSLAGTYPLSTFKPALETHLVIDDTQTDPHTAEQYDTVYAPAHLRALVSVPLLRNEQWIATLWVADSQPRQWTNREVKLIHTVAERMWLAIESAWLHTATQALNTLLEAQVAERTAELNESQLQLRKLSAYTERAREEERTRIAREVHDQLGSELTALKMDLTQMGRKQYSQAELSARIQELRDHIDVLVQTVRRIASDLRPPLLDDFGLMAALEWQAGEWSRRTGITCQLDLLPMEVPLSPEQRTAVFRVFQEALTNIARHAQATQTTITLREADEQLVLTIHDNGRGIDEERVRQSKSLGLLGMRERMREVSGELEITGAPGQGTTVTIRVPR